MHNTDDCGYECRSLQRKCTYNDLIGRGYEQAEKDLGWISVKDRLPEEGHFVFTCSEDEGHPQCVGVSCLLKGQWWDGEGHLNVEYWMEIPKLPKEEKK